MKYKVEEFDVMLYIMVKTEQQKSLKNKKKHHCIKNFIVRQIDERKEKKC